jgi:hypothetical protein
LSRIDKIIDLAIGFEMMTLLDYFLGEYQIWHHKQDEEKTNFITPFGTYIVIWECPKAYGREA